MKILTLSFYLGLLLVETSQESHAYGEQQSGQTNEFHQPSLIINKTQLPLFPQEPQVDSFPDVIDKESNTQDLRDYYQTVAQAYRNWGNKQEKQVQTAHINLLNSQENAFWKSTRVSNFQSYSPHVSAHHQIVIYYQDQHTKENDKLRLINEKTKFYQDIADYYKSIANS